MLSSSSLSPSPAMLNFSFKSPSLAPHRTRSAPFIVTCATTTTTTTTTYKQKQSSSSSYSNFDFNLYSSPHPMASCSSLYEILRIPVGATGQEIKSAYRKLARTCHPDVAAFDRKDTSAGEFMSIHAAYSTLSDPQKRAVYDSQIFRRSQHQQQRPLTSAGVAVSGYGGGRRWETDQCW